MTTHYLLPCRGRRAMHISTNDRFAVAKAVRFFCVASRPPKAHGVHKFVYVSIRCRCARRKKVILRHRLHSGIKSSGSCARACAGTVRHRHPYTPTPTLRWCCVQKKKTLKMTYLVTDISNARKKVPDYKFSTILYFWRIVQKIWIILKKLLEYLPNTSFLFIVNHWVFYFTIRQQASTPQWCSRMAKILPWLSVVRSICMNYMF